MTQLYGAAFPAAYGDSPPPIWVAAIANLSDEQCAAGFRALAEEAREYPPNLTQFVAACRPPKGSPRFLGVPITPNELRRLGQQKAREETSRKYIDLMRELFR